ncbi:TetR/AcrR family transcriptional regulator [Dactylosporangium sp. NPDC048998]|uniref:TetR/AcrR family transcriptional regulator n=1 Tax=Dactylosporangium sp. NPDC048998 TaxID=3363976 RepID=UPI003719EE19
MSAHEDDIPPVLAAAWGLRERPGKGPRPGLTLERIVAAGVRVAAAEGLGAVSMGRVASELGASTMSLYRYVTAKDELLDLMVDAAIGQPPALPPGEGWRAGLTRFAHTYLDLLRRQPWVIRVPINSPPITPNQIAWMNYGLATMAGTALRQDERLYTIMIVSGIVRNWALIAADISAAAQAGGVTAEQAMFGYGRLLKRLADPARFPAVGELIASGVLETPEAGPDDDFEFGLARFLDGLEALIGSRKTA